MAGGSILRLLVLAGLLLAAAPAFADDREYCPTRPGLGTTPCTIAPGRVSIESGLADWQRAEDSTERSDTLLIGDTLLRMGLGDAIEAQVGWTPFGQQRVRQQATHATDSISRVGDAVLGLKANLSRPDGSGFSLAVQPFVTLPVGRAPIGAGDWGAGLVVPVSFDLGHSISLQVTPEIDASVDSDGNGRHLAYSGVAGIGFPLGGTLSGTVEFQAVRDDDPSGGMTQTYAALSIGWMIADDLQFDIGGVAGLNGASTDAEVYVGISRRL